MIRTLLCALLLTTVAHAEVYHKEQVVAEDVPFKLGPYVTFPAPGTATVHWHTHDVAESKVSFTDGEAPSTTITRDGLHKMHAVELTGLEPDTVYAYRIPSESGESENEYLFDTTFNYAREPVPDVWPYEEDRNEVEGMARAIVMAAEKKGYAVLNGVTSPALPHALARQTELHVLCLSDDPEVIQQIRRQCFELGIYGSRITARHVDRIAQGQLTPHYANFLVQLQPAADEEWAGLLDLVRPGGVILTRGDRDAIEAALAGYPLLKEVGQVGFNGDPYGPMSNEFFVVIEKALFDSSGRWTHQYADAANSSYSGDSLAGAESTDDMAVQWLGRPGADFGIDRNPRMPAPLSVNGRLFHQGLNRMIAMDAYNGAILWLNEMPGLRRVNIPRDASNWCADEDYLYTAIRDRVWKIDQYTGELRYHYALPEEGAYEWSYVARAEGLLFGSSAKAGSTYTDYWGGSSWYDQTQGPGTYKVCSEKFYALDPELGTVEWSYAGGKIVNTTIAIGDGGVYFVESRHPKLNEAPTSRIEMDELWLDQYLVALDAKTGEKRWEQPLDLEDGVVVFFLVYADNTLTITSSHTGKYYLYAFDAEAGEKLWEASHAWPDGDHGGHMQHQAIARNTVFVEPHGYDLRSGELVYEQIGKREGCATVAATKHSLIYRGRSRRVAMWGMDEQKDSTWTNLRPSCWLSVVPANGMIMAPEGGGGCSCGGWMETSLGFIPKALQR